MDQLLAPDKLTLFLGLFLATSLSVVLAILIDLWDGIHTARATRQRVHSHKLRVTIAKMSEYWRFIVIGFLIDCLGLCFAFYFVPFVAMIFGAGLIVTEIKSMFEHARRRKSAAAGLSHTIQEIIRAASEADARRILAQIKETEPTRQ